MAYPLSLWEAIAGLLGRSASILPGDMPGYPSDRHPPGYDADAARWAQIARGLMDAGVRVATAPRGQAIGQGVQGLVEGLDSGRRRYEEGLPGGADGAPTASRLGAGDIALLAGADPGSATAGYGLQPVLDPGPPGGGQGHEPCRLIPSLSPFGLCFYLCPSGAIIRGNSTRPGGCPAFRFRGQGMGPDSDMM
ncbi:MAG TPA: hypothetical protein VHA10_09270 [Hypericibacter adhaerens]|uniref:hypothetical protein n=1 Tax=Hypericibacter adhaerens TaxID=2602016 RepID=UPI002C33103C|nr:hypothetical protein [Hypericibacter adhaerens]HWA43386.1 hypothetical protein [Hypericibacter adhaerens]